MSIRAFEVLDSSCTWRITVCLIVLESMVAIWASIGKARKLGGNVWLLARLAGGINDGIGRPRKSNRAVAVPRAVGVSASVESRQHPLVSNLLQGHSSGSNLAAWATGHL